MNNLTSTQKTTVRNFYDKIKNFDNFHKHYSKEDFLALFENMVINEPLKNQLKNFIKKAVAENVRSEDDIVNEHYISSLWDILTKESFLKKIYNCSKLKDYVGVSTEKHKNMILLLVSTEISSLLKLPFINKCKSEFEQIGNGKCITYYMALILILELIMLTGCIKFGRIPKVIMKKRRAV